MARTIENIYNDLLPRVKAALGIDEATIISATSLEGMLTYVFAFCTNILEVIFDDFRAEVDSKIATLKPHSLKWYATITEDFRYGQAFDEETGAYDDTGLTPEEIGASKIIAYVAVLDQEAEDRLRVKVAKQGSEDLETLTVGEKEALEAYLAVRKDAGVKIKVESNEADKLKLELDVYVDPLVFNADGTLIADGSTPVEDAVIAYLRNLPFNGIFALSLMVDQVQQVAGVVLPQVISAESTYGSLPFTSINAFVVPDAGFLRFDEPTDLVVNYKYMSPLT